MRQPRGGIPGLNHDDRLLAKVPIYGVSDAGRGFWKKLRRVLTKEAGLRENQFLKALYVYSNPEGKVMFMMATHVDDLLWANRGSWNGLPRLSAST